MLLLSAVIVLSLSSCFVLGGFDEYGVILVENESDDTIYFLYISNANSMSWGEDVLGSDIILPGDGYYLNVPAGYYDIQVANFFNVELDSIYDQAVYPGETTVVTYY